MIKVGITGNIGSGKSLVCRIFSFIGIPIYDADFHAKRLMVENVKVKAAITRVFGKEAYIGHELNRSYLAKIVFEDASMLEALNQIVHPAVQQDVQNWFEHLPQDLPYAIEEAALLFESGSYVWFDKIIVVSAPESLRLERIVKRDHSTRESIKKRMDKQWPEKKIIDLADFIIYNDGSSMLLPQIMKIHEKLSQNLTIDGNF